MFFVCERETASVRERLQGGREGREVEGGGGDLLLLDEDTELLFALNRQCFFLLLQQAIRLPPIAEFQHTCHLKACDVYMMAQAPGRR